MPSLDYIGNTDLKRVDRKLVNSTCFQITRRGTRSGSMHVIEVNYMTLSGERTIRACRLLKAPPFTHKRYMFNHQVGIREVLIHTPGGAQYHWSSCLKLDKTKIRFLDNYVVR